MAQRSLDQYLLERPEPAGDQPAAKRKVPNTEPRPWWKKLSCFECNALPVAGMHLWVCQDNHYHCVECRFTRECPCQARNSSHYCWAVCTCRTKCHNSCVSCPSKKMRRDLLTEQLADRVYTSHPLFYAAEGEAPNTLTNAVKAVPWEDLLGCPSCFCIPRPGEDIFSCVNGHLTCGECYLKILALPRPEQKCPSCRSEDFGYHARSAEFVIRELLSQINQECRFDFNGCSAKLPLDHLSNHERICR